MIAIALLALIAMVAGQRFAKSGQTPAAADTESAGSGSIALGPAPDISQMTPDEQAQRLRDLIMGAFSRGHLDTVQMFVPMGIGAYEMLPSLTLGQRYDLGRLGVVSGNVTLAAAEADTILKQYPNHLLGLALAAQAAEATHDTAAEHRYLDRLVKAAPAEQAKNLPEYKDHATDIKIALDQAGKR